MSQLNFALPARPVATSREAAERARVFAGRQRRIVHAWIVSRGQMGSTQREAAEALGIARASLCPRFAELSGRYGFPRLIERLEPIVRRQGCAVYHAVAS